MKVLLYVYNISGYLLAEVKALTHIAEVAIWEVPCNLSDEAHRDMPHVRWIDRTKITSLDMLLKSLDNWVPDVYLCVGWVDVVAVRYARWIKAHGKSSVLMVDTPWRGDYRQRIHALFSRFTLVSSFNYAWGAGKPQTEHLLKLGFKESVVSTGMYAADTERFSNLYKGCYNGRWAHEFLYVGRYIPVKNMRKMELAFLKALEECPMSDWHLLCIGGGELWNERTIHNKIKHIGYVNPNDMQNFVRDAGCFVLPSIYEPWGVVVHEFALAGLPMICSNRVQSTTSFLEPNKNGYLFNPESVDDISAAMKRIMRMSDYELAQMGKISHQKGLTYTTQDWANKVASFRRG